MPKTLVINLGKTDDKWLKLLLHLQNAVPMVFRIRCEDEATAKDLQKRLAHCMNRQPTWFANIIITKRGSNVYVVKVAGAQEIVIRDE